MSEFTEQYAKLNPLQRRKARKDLEDVIAGQLMQHSGFSKAQAKNAARKMVDRSMAIEKKQLLHDLRCHGR